MVNEISGISSSVVTISWSPNSKYFIAAGEREKPDGIIYDVENEKTILHLSSLNFTNLYVCAWFPDNFRFIIGGRQGQIYTFVF